MGKNEQGRALGSVAAGHPDTAAAAHAILLEGGNAIDAAIAAILVSTIAEGPLTGLGGGGYATVRDTNGEVYSVDFFVDTPGLGLELTTERRTRGFHGVDIDFGSTNQVFHVGGGSIAVPGLPLGVEHLSKRFGTLPMSRLVEPAIQAARDGIVVTDALAQMVDILQDIACGSDMGHAFYCPNGALPRSGDRLLLPQAATYLEDFAQRGAEPTYRGDIAQKMIDAVDAADGYLTSKDLSSYRVKETPSEQSSLGNIRLHMPPAPGLGGPLIAFALDILGADTERLHDFGEAAIIRLAAAQAATDSFRNEIVDPLLLTGYGGVQHRNQDIQNRYRQRYEAWLEKPHGLATPVPSSAVGSTTHISVVAGDGTVCSVTTSNGEGSTVWIEELGFHINNMLGEEDLHPGSFHRYDAGIRLPSMMAPTIAETPDGRIVALGSGGSNRLRSAILQVVLHHLARNESMANATQHPRVHLENGILDIEPGIDTAIVNSLAQKGMHINRWNQTNLYFGGVHAAGTDANGQFSAAGDPRRGGVAMIATSS